MAGDGNSAGDGTTAAQTNGAQATGAQANGAQASGAQAGGAQAGAAQRADGLRVQRVWTTPGVHPYDQVTWERRDVVMTNWRDGSINFEQRGVEFPDFWSVNASNIVTSKYFRGAVGTPQREWSLKQLIDRVVNTYRAAGEQHGYFAAPADAEVFAHELTYLLLHQHFSFNSPVWFNVGTTSPQQVSACLPYDSLVSTPAGLVPIGRLVEDDAVGAKVYDAHGVTRILATKANGVRDVLRLHTTAGYTLDVTGDHLVWRGGDGFVEAGTIRPGDLLEWHPRDSYGEAQFDSREVAEAALAGWLQSDGLVADHDGVPTIEAMTVRGSEWEWLAAALDGTFPEAERREEPVGATGTDLDCRRVRLAGEHLRPFVDKWGLHLRRTEARVPAPLFAAPLPVVTAYLRSVFQAEGYVAVRERATVVGVDLPSLQQARGTQHLLLRFGIFARVTGAPHGGWSVHIPDAGDRELFAREIGFVDARKTATLEQSNDAPIRAGGASRALEVERVEHLGAQPVYDIQTESGEFLAANIRVHNCFILSVDDSMDSILEWYKEEGLIFKGGSGSGVNLSRIRSSRELLSSGGTASGPVSFMRGADASAGTIKSGGATRRAAKMVILDVDHPDVEEFIETKAREENKIRALRDAGFDMDLGGRDIVSVQYQNANNSVRVTDEFMRAVEKGEKFDLLGRLDGAVVDTVDARELFRKMARAAWECADPGIQYDDTINDWHTNPETGRITASNPCSEYMSLDNSSCNLASLNLMKFLDGDGSFDTEKFVKAVEFVITAMDISICFADFPTEKIGNTTRAYRQLGIGYANLGALLMAIGLPYDSDDGRALAAAITSLMTGTSYRRSAELAGIVGPYDGYARNAGAHQRVMRKHAAANDEIRTKSPNAMAVVKAAGEQWQGGNEVGAINGWRNAQASVIAPTGTISFMLDCDTTGIEPDLALVKFKKLVGGGSMQIVNQTVPRALANLGYQPEQAEAIVEYIAEHGHVVDAPGLRPEHYPVFDCAMGERSIAPMGHVRMMAATQPFISGAISKTVNLPESATVEDVEHTYFEGWRLGLKALAIYRDNCKVGQPLSSGKEARRAAEPEKVIEYRPVRKRLPKKRPSQTVSFAVGDAEGYLTASSYPDDGLGEIFLKFGKQGSTLAGVMDAFSIAVSVALQYGVPLEKYLEKFMNMRFEPAGMTDDPDIRMATSVMDYVARRLALDFLPYEKRADLGIFTAEERAAQVRAESGDDDVDLTALASSPVPEKPAPVPAREITEAIAPPDSDAGSSTELVEAVIGKAADAPLCLTCGTKMRPAGSCYVCEGCGSTSGCS
jgi:ribonucleoside-diphosphate reductase alpha chain